MIFPELNVPTILNFPVIAHLSSFGSLQHPFPKGRGTIRRAREEVRIAHIVLVVHYLFS
jgi:hypothetical protein